MANLINEINTARVLQRLWYGEGNTRVDLARDLGLSKSTLTNIVNALIARDLVHEVEAGQSGQRVGRPPQVLEINARYGCILGLEIQTELCKAVATDFKGEVILSDSRPLDMAGKGVSTAFAEVVRTFLPKLRDTGLPLRGVGLGAAGIIDPWSGTIIQSNPLGVVSPLRFYDEIAGILDVPVAIENDANCCSWGELAFHKTDRHRSFAFVLGEFRKGRTEGSEYWGPAVGMGLVLDGRVRHGEGFSAGEFQSILWEEGNRGQFSLGDADSAKVKDESALRAAVIRELCAHVAFLVNTLNLTCVVFGGEMARYREEISSCLRAEIRRNWSYPNEVECAIEFASLGELAVAYGAAGMFLERFFSIPGAVPGDDGPSPLLEGGDKT